MLPSQEERSIQHAIAFVQQPLPPHQCRNRITEVPPEFFTNAPKLKKLVLASNMLKTLPSEVYCCTELENLQLQANQLESLPEGTGSPALETLFVQVSLVARS